LPEITDEVTVGDARQRPRAQPLLTYFATVRWLARGTEGNER